MRFLNNSSSSRNNEDVSTPSSVQSVDSYGIFGSSDYSDCEFCDERRRGKPVTSIGTPYYSLSPSTVSYRSAMERDCRETAPLLGTAAPVAVYQSHSSDSDSLGPADLSSKEILSEYNKRFEESLKPERKKQSSLVTIFSVWNTIMGSSLLTMAWGVERAGLPAALILVAAMSALCLYTAYVLLMVNKHHGAAAGEVPALCRALLGPGAAAAAHAFSLLVLLGANVVYWILITNFLYFSVNYLMDLNSNTTDYGSVLLCPSGDGGNGSLLIPPARDDPPYWGLHSTVPLYVAVIIFPLLNFRNVTFFTKFNSLGTLSVVYLVVFVAVKGWSWGVHLPAGGGARHAAVLSGMLALSFYIHNIIITIMSSNARQENNGRDLTIAFVLVTVTYTLVGAVFYICFPLAKSCIEDNLLNNFEMHDVMTAVARVLLLFQVVTVYPLVAYMLRCEAVLLLPLQETTRLRVSINLAIVTVCILVACFCPSIGTIIRYTGAVSGLVHVFALPALLRARSLQLRGELTCCKALFYAAIVAFGALNLLMQFFIDD